MLVPILVLFTLVIFGTPVSAKEISLELGNGTELAIEEIGEGPNRILWIPSEFSRADEEERQLLTSLAASGEQVWWLDLHSHYFIASGRNSYDEIPVEELAQVIELSFPEQGGLTLMATGRGARVALEMTRLWQLKYADKKMLEGVILLHPNLASGIAQAGELATLHPIAYATDLPIYILQPFDSSKRWYLGQLAAALSKGGSDVYSQLIKDVTDGFQVRDDITDYEREVRKTFPSMVAEAKRLLTTYNSKTRNAVKNLGKPSVDEERGKLEGGLQPIASKPIAPPLKLKDLNDVEYDLKRYRGRKVLINFWATWCPPCVKEIPSLGRLQKQFYKEDLIVLSVDVGEEKSRVVEFTKRVPADFPVMLDPEGNTVKSWKLRAFPTTFLLDEEGRVRYGYYGGLEWDDPEVVALIKAMK